MNPVLIWNGRASVMFVFCCWFVNGISHMVALYCPCSSICSNLLILPSSLLLYLPASLTQVPPVVQSISRISTSYLLHSAVYAPTPYPHHAPCGAVQAIHQSCKPWRLSYISPIPSVAGTLASHLLCLLLSQVPLLLLPFTRSALLFPPFGSSTSFSHFHLITFCCLSCFFLFFCFFYSYFPHGLILP